MDIELVMGARGDINTIEQAEKGGPSTTLPAYNNDISFRSVAPVDIAIWGLVVAVEASVSAFDKLRLRLQKQGPDNQINATKSKTILGDVSADFPRGTLTAIIGGSGSGKTTL